MTSYGRKALTNLLLPGALTLAGITAPALAQEAPAAPAAASAPNGQVDGNKILELLVAKGVITREEARAIQAQATAPAPAVPTPAPQQPSDVQTIPYIPDTVKRQIKEELRGEMATKAETEGWAQPDLIPGWLDKVTLYADLRVRDEEDRFDPNNDPSIPNFQAINTGSPYNINRAVPGSPNPPYLDTLENRNRTRIRARVGLIARADSWVSFEIRAATGNDGSPVSPNQTLGSSGGNFSKYSVWLDRADLELTPHGVLEGLRVDLGRGENPFWSTPLLFYPDLQFDGFYARYRHDLGQSLHWFGTAGAFPIYNASLNFGSNDVGAFQGHNKWLFAGQLGGAWQATEALKLTAAAAYFDFNGVQGKLSSPCNYNQDVCDTDDTRPGFQQYGNSLMPIRNIVADPTAAPGLSPEPQYFGLASAFRVLDLHAALDITSIGPVPVRIEGDFIRNLAFHRGDVLRRQINVGSGSYQPGGKGYYGNLILGKPDIVNFGDWNFQVGYRHLESDATVDGLADADFHLGGTNAKGYVLMGYFGFARNTSIAVRWFSADTISGLPYSNDVLQVDLNTKF